jgi:hypothetical protein
MNSHRLLAYAMRKRGLETQHALAKVMLNGYMECEENLGDIEVCSIYFNINNNGLMHHEFK